MVQKGPKAGGTVLFVLPVILVALAVAAAALFMGTPQYPQFQVTVCDEDRTFDGYSLFAPTVDDLGYELQDPNEVYLVDMKGNIVHRWQVPGAVQLAKLKPDGNLPYTTMFPVSRSRTD